MRLNDCVFLGESHRWHEVYIKEIMRPARTGSIISGKTRSGVGETLLTRNWSVAVLNGSHYTVWDLNRTWGSNASGENQIETKLGEVVMFNFKKLFVWCV